VNPIFLLGAGLLCVTTLSLLLPAWLQGPRSTPARWGALALALLLPAGAGLLYAQLGEPGALRPARSSGESLTEAALPADLGAVRAMVARLSQRLAAQPEDAAGWQLLVRAHEALGQPEQALAGYAQLQRLRPDDPDVLTQHAVTLALARSSGLAGEPEALIQAALRLAPDHPQALALAGSAALERGDRAAARRHWERLLAQTPADSEAAAALRESLGRL